jgi:hypothetical protein
MRSDNTNAKKGINPNPHSFKLMQKPWLKADKVQLVLLILKINDKVYFFSCKMEQSPDTLRRL